MLISVTVMCLCAGVLRLAAAVAAADRSRSFKASLWFVAGGVAAAASVL